MSTVISDARRRELAAIHCAARDLGLDDETYRDVLWSVARARTAGDLDAYQRGQVLEHMRARGWTPRRPGRPRPAPDRGRLLGKIDRLLTERRRGRAYADGIARRMGFAERVDWCTPDQLRRIVAALKYDERRHG